LILFTAQTIRNRVIGMPAMLFVAGTTMFWIEWPADWGSYLVYNKDFWAFTGWTSTWYQTYWKPVGVIFGYGIFFAVECIILLKVVPRVSAGLQRILPRISPTAMLVVACAGVFYLVEILSERLMTWLGWYSYVEAVGWSWTSDRGTISFVWPAIPFLLSQLPFHCCSGPTTRATTRMRSGSRCTPSRRGGCVNSPARRCGSRP
jgi:hypothetical protein